MKTSIGIASAALLLSLTACGGDDTTESSGTTSGGADCGTVDDPVFFALADVTPAQDAVVPGDSVVHSFRVVDAPALVQELTFQVGTGHTAGQPTPAALSFTVKQEGTDLVYTATPVAWSQAGHVELSVPARYQAEGCVYAFPEPFFSYEVEPSQGAGGGGAGGAGAGGDGTGGDAAGAGGS